MFSVDFRGQEIDSFIDGSKIRHFPSKTRQGYILQSVVSIVSLVVLVIGVVASIYVIRLTILESDVSAYDRQLYRFWAVFYVLYLCCCCNIIFRGVRDSHVLSM